MSNYDGNAHCSTKFVDLVKMTKVKKPRVSGTRGTEAGNTKSASVLARSHKFRRMCFTYNNYTDEHYTQIVSFCRKESSKWIIGKEIAPGTGTPHLQGYMEFANPRSWDSLRRMWPWHLEKAKGTADENFVYCSKDNDFVSDGWDDLWQIPSDPMAGLEWKDWQVQLKAELGGEPHPRKIIWYYDPVGNAGKSTFATHMMYHDKDLLYVDGGSCADLKAALAGMKEEGTKPPKIVILDLPKSRDPKYVSYDGLEAIKNGAFLNTKYHSCTMRMPRPHMVVFANCLPDVSKMSADRWDIRTISSLAF